MVLGVPAPQAGRLASDVDESVHVGQAVARTASIHTGATRVACSARQEHLDGDAIPTATAIRRGALPEPLDHADDLVTGMNPNGAVMCPEYCS